MPSTYSNLKIQLMATGENNSSWGDVTNVNLGTALEEAIVGSADVTFASANVTLTLNDTNASQAARNVRLRCIGTTGGSTRNLVVPSIEKPYVIKNECADSILVKTTAGSGITVPAGKTMWVYNNGTDVVDATNYLTELTLGTALPVTSGGTGSNTAAGARTSLGLGTISTQNSNSVTITGGSITGITDLAIADGGTGASTAADARTNLGATTVGGNVFTLINPSAITFPRFNADNTVSALDAASFRTAIGANAGTVTSVGGTGTVNGITLTGSVTTSGTLTLGGTLSGVSLTTQVTDTLPIANGGTNATTAAGARASLSAAASGANTDLTSLSPTGSLTLNPTTGTLIGAPTGGVQGAGTINATGLFVNGVAVGTGAGTVSSVSVVSSNGFAGTVATATSTPAITLTTTITGVLKGNGTAISAATAGTDYVAPGGALGTPSSGTLTNCTFPTLNQNTTGSAATLTTARTLTIGATGQTFNGSANVTWTLTQIGAAASGANTDITALDQDVTVTATGTISASTIGYRGIPQNSQSGAYTLVLADAGKHISNSTGGFAIPANGTTAFPVGTTIVLYNNSSSSQNITITSDTLRLAGTATTGTLVLAERGLATCVKVGTTTWVASGAGLS